MARQGLRLHEQGRGPLHDRKVLHWFHEALNRAGLPRQSFHSLRHAFATLQLEHGEELGVVSRILGHSQIAKTADVYAHLTVPMLERSASRMDDVLRRSQVGKSSEVAAYHL